MTTKIRWSFEEHELLEVEVLRLVNSGERYDDLRHLVIAAQKVLPASRRRTLVHIQHVPQRLRKILEKSLPKAKADRLKQLQLQTEEQEHPTPVPTPAPVPVPGLGAMLSSALVEVVVDVLSNEKVISALRNLLAKHQVELTGPEGGAPLELRLLDPSHQREKDNLPVALMVGLKPDQRAPFERRYANTLRLKWWYDEAYHVLKDKARMADAVFATVKAFSHSSKEAIESTPNGRDKLHLSSGGTGEMFDRIDAWLRAHPRFNQRAAV